MSREAYQVPSLGGGQNAFGTEGFAGSVDGPVVAYLCGECNSRVSLKRGDQIRCKECGHRVLYKERTKRLVHDSTVPKFIGFGRYCINERSAFLLTMYFVQ